MDAVSYDAKTAECLLFTEKAGLLAGAAHDLKLLVERFELELSPSAAAPATGAGVPSPGGPARLPLSVKARFDPGSVRVACARQEGRDAPGVLSAKDRADIEATIARTVLEAQRYPSIEFRSTAIVPHESGGFRVEGVLSLHGRERPIAMLARRQGELAIVDGRLHQPDFGITPYSAMLGALKIKPDVGVRVVVPWPAGA
jgi:hypothetical protein